MNKVNTKNKSAPKTTRHTGREIGLELRKTHFILGNYNPNFSSQYRNDYFSENNSIGNQNQNFVNPNLKKDQIVLGKYTNNFVTTSMAQNMDLDARRKDFKMVHLDEKLKDELRTSHFLLGNSTPSYQTVFQSQFYAKNNENKINSSAHAHPNKPMGHKMGNDKVEYNSETHVKFAAPVHARTLSLNQPSSKISTQELQNSHYVFGKDQQSWATSSQISFKDITPLANSNRKTLLHSNLEFGNSKTNYETTQKTSHPVINNMPTRFNKDPAIELRKHSIILGNDSNINKMSKNTQDYLDPKMKNPDISPSKLDNNTLRQTHFTIGYPHQAPLSQYQTTYDTNMFYKTNPRQPGQGSKFVYIKPNVKVVGQGPGSYSSENQMKYQYKVNEITQKEMNEMKGIIKDIRGHHWDNGSKTGSYTTTNNQFMKYDTQRARFAAIPLTEEHKNDLRYSHYELGKGSIPLSTTHVSTYLPIQNIQKNFFNQSLKNSSIEFNPKHSNIKGNTVYMSDFTVKENVE